MQQNVNKIALAFTSKEIGKLSLAFNSCKARDLWVTHFVVLQNVNKIALAFTSKEIG